jgi:diguanylate cyclase (GGDEF)-like protein
MQSSLKPYLLLVGDSDWVTEVYAFLEKKLPGFTIFVALNALEAIRTMHQLDRPTIFVVSYELPDATVPNLGENMAMDGLTLITQNVRKTFHFDSFCFVVTDNVEVVDKTARLKIRCLRKSQSSNNCQDCLEKRRYNLDDYFVGDLKWATEELKDIQVDALTKIYNLSGAMKRWERDFERARTLKSTTAFLLGDLDDLKMLNEKYGRLAADKVIVAVADVFRRNCRTPYDVPARLGIGDEFGIFMPATKQKGAESLRERITEDLKKLSIKVAEGVFYTPTMSFGMSTLKPGSLGRSADEAYKEKLFKPAERALHRNKILRYKTLAESGDVRGKEKYEQYMSFRKKAPKAQ